MSSSWEERNNEELEKGVYGARRAPNRCPPRGSPGRGHVETYPHQGRNLRDDDTQKNRFSYSQTAREPAVTEAVRAQKNQKGNQFQKSHMTEEPAGEGLR